MNRKYFVVFLLVAIVLSAIPALAINLDDEWKVDLDGAWLRTKENLRNDIGNKRLALRLFEQQYDEVIKEKDRVERDWVNIGRMPTEDMRKEYDGKIRRIKEMMALVVSTTNALKKGVRCSEETLKFMESNGLYKISSGCLEYPQ